MIICFLYFLAERSIRAKKNPKMFPMKLKLIAKRKIKKNLRFFVEKKMRMRCL